MTDSDKPQATGHSPQTVLVTGAAGFIGSHLSERLVSEGHHVIGLDNFNDFYDPEIKKRNISDLLDNPNFDLIPGDILNTELLDAIFTGDADEIRRLSLDLELPHTTTQKPPTTYHRPQTSSLEKGPQATHHQPQTNTHPPQATNHPPKQLVHLAALAGVRPSLVSPTKYVDTDIKGTVNLLEMAKEHEVDKFIFGSSSSVYGINEKVPFSEDDVTDLQISPYAAAKKSAEQYCKTYNHLYDIPIAALRFFTSTAPASARKWQSTSSPG